MKTYTGQFYDLNEVKHKVIIRINTSATGGGELQFTTSPVVITLENDDNIFKPCKYTSATINLISVDYNMYFVANKITDIEVDVYKINDPEDDGDFEVIFSGYVLPESFNQAFNNTYNEYSLNCIDKLAATKYFKYEKINDGQFVSFLDILKYIFFDRLNLTYIDYDDSVCSLSLGQYEFDGDILASLYISETNFFNEDDEPWLLSEVVEEMMKYLCCSCYMKGGNTIYVMYLPSYNSSNIYRIRHRKNYNYYQYTYTNFIYNLDYINDDCSNGSISVNPAFNEIKLVSDNYPIDFSEANMLNEDYENITDTQDATLQSGRILPFIGYLYKLTQPIKPDNKDKEYWWLTSFLKPKGNITLSGYNDGGTATDTSIYPTDLTSFNRYVGCCLIGQNITDAKIDEEGVEYNNLKLNYNFTPSLKNKLVMSLIPYKTMDEDYRYPTDDDIMLHYVSTSPIVAGQNFFITFNISGELYGVRQGKYASLDTVDEREQFNFSSISNQNTNTHAFSGIEDKIIPLPSEPSLTAILRFGEYYWSGQGWQQSYTTFELPLEKQESYGRFTNKKTSKFTQNIPSGLYTIPCNIGTGVLNGIVEFSLVYPHKFVQYYATMVGIPQIDISALYFDEFAIEIVNSSVNTKAESNTDSTEYMIVIDDDNITEYSTIEQKICTWDNLAPNYSSVYIGPDEDELYFVDKMWFDYDNEVRFEERALQLYYSQLYKPQLEYTVDINKFIEPHDLVQYDFLADYVNVNRYVLNGYNFDVANCVNTLTLRELKEFVKPEISKENIDRQYYRTGLIYKANP